MLLVGSLALGGCTAKPDPVKKAATPTTPTKTAAVKKPPPRFKAVGMPAELARVIKPLYLGGPVPSTSPAGVALNKRRPLGSKGPTVVVKGAMGAFNSVPIAVVTRGKDVTLAVKAPTGKRAPRWKVVGGWWPSLRAAKPSLGGSARRVLFIGSDARKAQSVNGSRADSLHIVSYDGRGAGGVLGIARDAYMPLSTGGQGKVNSALPLGGPLAVQRTVSSATGVPLDGYLITGFDGFRKVINGIGGLPINVPVAIHDEKAQANIKAGKRRLDGSAALAYGRARYTVAGGDFGRSRNQGRLILAAAGFARQAGPARLPAILRMSAPRIKTNMSAQEVLLFAAGVYVTNPKKVANRVAAGGFGMTSGGESIVRLDGEARRMFADIRNGSLS